MSETRKLTLEIEVPADQVPKNATGSLLWQVPERPLFVGKSIERP